LKLQIEIDGESYTLTLERQSQTAQYTLTGVANSSGSANIAELMPGTFSILLGTRSIEARVVPAADNLQIHIAGRRHRVSVADLRDRPNRGKKAGAHGPVEIRSQMPGKIVKLLVERGAAVHTGQGLIVVEAMKMQNEMKSPKDGIATKIYVPEGVTVGAGEALLLIE
jgi:biotin carboxyl carrier protein